MKLVLARRMVDRIVLAIYMIALVALLTLPIEGPNFQFLGIGSDKWMHLALFGGLAMLLRSNFSMNRHALLLTLGVALIVAIATEVTQGLVAYRSADLRDIFAGLVGAMLGATMAHRLLSSGMLRMIFGPVVVILGCMIGAFFLLADVIGVGDSKQFGAHQMAGVIIGALIATGGVGVHFARSRQS